MSSPFTIIKIIKSKASSEEEALAPLRAALPWNKQFQGELMAPRCKIQFIQGEGRRRTVVDLSIEVSPILNGYSVTISATWLDWASIITMPLVAVALYFIDEKVSFFVGGCSILFMPILALNNKNCTCLALDEISFAYRAGLPAAAIKATA